MALKYLHYINLAGTHDRVSGLLGLSKIPSDHSDIAYMQIPFSSTETSVWYLKRNETRPRKTP